ncbi:MAG TPA: GNAT family N-acetyltransferase [Fimbriimonas sp.]|nr:GNAT family N-acetyltransferase [Fimbriimonas sp.]
MSIRLATRADEPAIQHVIKTVYDELGWGWFPEDYHQDLYNIDEHYLGAGHPFWVYEDDGVVVGTCALHVYETIPGSEGTVLHEGFVRVAGSDCSIERLYILPEHQGKGIGSRLWDHCVEFARSNGKKRMEIWSDKILETAHILYERRGAVMVGERLCHDPAQSPEWGMSYDI